jgi:hypothetical protein
MTQKPVVLDPISPESERAHKIWRSVETIKKLSDRIVGIGPFGVGMDGLLTWIPAVGLLYTLGAGGYLIVQGQRAGASKATLTRMVLYLGLDALTTEIPLVGDLLDMVWAGHLRAARALQSDIESRFGPPPEALAPAGASRTRRKSSA